MMDDVVERPSAALLNEEQIARFWAYVDVRAPSECWEWKGTRNRKGYGLFHYSGRKIVASRAALTIKLGSALPSSTFACHTCDNPPCCNPNHLWPGTNRQNILDASSKRRLRNNRVEFCPKGHPYSGRNLVIVKGGQRGCLRCRMDVTNACRRRRKEAIHAGV